MRPQDIDAHGRVALHDTSTDEVTHVPLAIAQETIERNRGHSPKRFKVLEKGSANDPLSPTRVAHPGKRNKALAADVEAQARIEAHGGAMADATDVAHEGILTQLAKPEADAGPAAPEQDADPEKEVAAIHEEAKAKGVKLDGRIKDPERLRAELAEKTAPKS